MQVNEVDPMPKRQHFSLDQELKKVCSDLIDVVTTCALDELEDAQEAIQHHVHVWNCTIARILLPPNSQVARSTIQKYTHRILTTSHKVGIDLSESLCTFTEQATFYVPSKTFLDATLCKSLEEQNKCWRLDLKTLSNDLLIALMRQQKGFSPLASQCIHEASRRWSSDVSLSSHSCNDKRYIEITVHNPAARNPDLMRFLSIFTPDEGWYLQPQADLDIIEQILVIAETAAARDEQLAVFVADKLLDQALYDLPRQLQCLDGMPNGVILDYFDAHPTLLARLEKLSLPISSTRFGPPSCEELKIKITGLLQNFDYQIDGKEREEVYRQLMQRVAASEQTVDDEATLQRTLCEHLPSPTHRFHFFLWLSIHEPNLYARRALLRVTRSLELSGLSDYQLAWIVSIGRTVPMVQQVLQEDTLAIRFHDNGAQKTLYMPRLIAGYHSQAIKELPHSDTPGLLRNISPRMLRQFATWIQQPYFNMYSEEQPEIEWASLLSMLRHLNCQNKLWLLTRHGQRISGHYHTHAMFREGRGDPEVFLKDNKCRRGVVFHHITQEHCTVLADALLQRILRPKRGDSQGQEKIAGDLHRRVKWLLDAYSAVNSYPNQDPDLKDRMRRLMALGSRGFPREGTPATAQSEGVPGSHYWNQPVYLNVVSLSPKSTPIQMTKYLAGADFKIPTNIQEFKQLLDVAEAAHEMQSKYFLEICDSVLEKGLQGLTGCRDSFQDPRRLSRIFLDERIHRLPLPNCKRALLFLNGALGVGEVCKRKRDTDSDQVRVLLEDKAFQQIDLDSATLLAPDSLLTNGLRGDRLVRFFLYVGAHQPERKALLTKLIELITSEYIKGNISREPVEWICTAAHACPWLKTCLAASTVTLACGAKALETPRLELCLRSEMVRVMLNPSYIESDSTEIDLPGIPERWLELLEKWISCPWMAHFKDESLEHILEVVRMLMYFQAAYDCPCGQTGKEHAINAGNVTITYMMAAEFGVSGVMDQCMRLQRHIKLNATTAEHLWDWALKHRDSTPLLRILDSSKVDEYPLRFPESAEEADWLVNSYTIAKFLSPMRVKEAIAQLKQHVTTLEAEEAELGGANELMQSMQLFFNTCGPLLCDDKCPLIKELSDLFLIYLQVCEGVGVKATGPSSNFDHTVAFILARHLKLEAILSESLANYNLLTVNAATAPLIWDMALTNGGPEKLKECVKVRFENVVLRSPKTIDEVQQLRKLDTCYPGAPLALWVKECTEALEQSVNDIPQVEAKATNLLAWSAWLIDELRVGKPYKGIQRTRDLQLRLVIPHGRLAKAIGVPLPLTFSVSYSDITRCTNKWFVNVLGALVNGTMYGDARALSLMYDYLEGHDIAVPQTAEEFDGLVRMAKEANARGLPYFTDLAAQRIAEGLRRVGSLGPGFVELDPDRLRHLFEHKKEVLEDIHRLQLPDMESAFDLFTNTRAEKLFANRRAFQSTPETIEQENQTFRQLYQPGKTDIADIGSKITDTPTLFRFLLYLKPQDTGAVSHVAGLLNDRYCSGEMDEPSAEWLWRMSSRIDPILRGINGSKVEIHYGSKESCTAIRLLLCLRSLKLREQLRNPQVMSVTVAKTPILGFYRWLDRPFWAYHSQKYESAQLEIIETLASLDCPNDCPYDLRLGTNALSHLLTKDNAALLVQLAHRNGIKDLRDLVLSRAQDIDVTFQNVQPLWRIALATCNKTLLLKCLLHGGPFVEAPTRLEEVKALMDIAHEPQLNLVLLDTLLEKTLQSLEIMPNGAGPLDPQLLAFAFRTCPEVLDTLGRLAMPKCRYLLLWQAPTLNTGALLTQARKRGKTKAAIDKENRDFSNTLDRVPPSGLAAKLAANDDVLRYLLYLLEVKPREITRLRAVARVLCMQQDEGNLSPASAAYVWRLGALFPSVRNIVKESEITLVACGDRQRRVVMPRFVVCMMSEELRKQINGRDRSKRIELELNEWTILTQWIKQPGFGPVVDPESPVTCNSEFLNCLDAFGCVYRLQQLEVATAWASPSP